MAEGVQPATLDWTKGSLAEGLQLYEAGEFFAAHEAWRAGGWNLRSRRKHSCKVDPSNRRVPPSPTQKSTWNYAVITGCPASPGALSGVLRRHFRHLGGAIFRNGPQTLNSDEPVLGLAPPRMSRRFPPIRKKLGPMLHPLRSTLLSTSY